MRDLREAGVASETVSRMVREGTVLRVARGLYQLADTMPEPRRIFAEASALVPKGVVCLTSALQFHELTLQIPPIVWMAIERSGWKPKVEYPPIRIVRFGDRGQYINRVNLRWRCDPRMSVAPGQFSVGVDKSRRGPRLMLGKGEVLLEQVGRHR